MADVIKINEPIATERTISCRLYKAGVGVNGVVNSNVIVKVAKPGTNAATDASCVLTEATGFVDTTSGRYRLALSTDSVSVAGEVEIEISDNSGLSLFDPTHFAVSVENLKEELYYGPISAATSTSITLSGAGTGAPVATNSYYAGGGRNCVAIVIAGTGKGESNFANAYVGSTKVLSFPVAWATTLDSTSIVALLPLHGQLDAATITSIQTRIFGLLQENAMIDNIIFGSNNLILSARVRVFADSTTLASAVAGHSNGADGEIERYTITAVDIGAGQFSSFTKARNL
jgi:hypothetical protein